MVSEIIVKDIIPIFVIMALGYFAAKKNAFSPDQTQGFNKLVLDIALPAALFVSITKASRQILISDIPLTLVSLIGVFGMFLFCVVISTFLFKRSLKEAGVCGLIAGCPTIGFLGFAVLEPIWGNSTSVGLVVAIVSIVVNAVNIPIGFYLVNSGLAKENPENGVSSGWSAVVSSLKQPVVVSPMIAVFLVLVGIRWPASWDYSFDLIAKANSGVAVFAAGLALATVKFSLGWEILWNVFYRMFLSPAVVCFLGLLFGMKGDALTMLVLACALPPAFAGIIISSRYNIYFRNGASSLAVSTLTFAVSAPFWLWAVPYAEKLYGV